MRWFHASGSIAGRQGALRFQDQRQPMVEIAGCGVLCFTYSSPPPVPFRPLGWGNANPPSIVPEAITIALCGQVWRECQGIVASITNGTVGSYSKTLLPRRPHSSWLISDVFPPRPAQATISHPMIMRGI